MTVCIAQGLFFLETNDAPGGRDLQRFPARHSGPRRRRGLALQGRLVLVPGRDRRVLPERLGLRLEDVHCAGQEAAGGASAATGAATRDASAAGSGRTPASASRASSTGASRRPLPIDVCSRHLYGRRAADNEVLPSVELDTVPASGAEYEQRSGRVHGRDQFRLSGLRIVRRRSEPGRPSHPSGRALKPGPRACHARTP